MDRSDDLRSWRLFAVIAKTGSIPLRSGCEGGGEEGLVAGSARPKMCIRYEPLGVAKAGLEAMLMHAGRSSQDVLATFQRAILCDETLKLLKAQAVVVTGFG